MCIAIHKPAGIKIDRDVLYSCWCGNSHGAGFVYVKDGALTIVKGLMTFGQFWAAYQEHKTDDYQALIHFRLATHGGRNQKNTHPFEVIPELALIHNGVIHSLHTIDRSMSDTWHFAQFMKGLVMRDRDAWKDPIIKQEIEHEILGTWNKVAFLHANGECQIYNRANWIEHEGALYSNGGFYRRSYGYRPEARTYSNLGGSLEGYEVTKGSSGYNALRALYRERQHGLDLPTQDFDKIATGKRLPRRARKIAEDEPTPAVEVVSIEELMAQEMNDDEGSTLGGGNSATLTKAADTLLASFLRNEEQESREAVNCDYCMKPYDPLDLSTVRDFVICAGCKETLKEEGTYTTLDN